MGHAVVAAEQAAEPYGVVHETHTGLVVLVGDLAYKVKKPIRTDFLDFSTLERREQVCQRELELNRRLAPDSYLGVAHLDTPWTDSREPVLVMKRQPESSRLSTMVRCGEPVAGQLEAIAAVLARFHRGAQRGPCVETQGSVDAVRHRWDANIAEMQQFVGTIIDEHRIAAVHRLAVQFIAGRELLFTRRIRDGRIVDGHGDMLADDIFCLPRGPEILDCLEFDDTLRYVDTIDDAAFLAMDLEFLGRKDLGEFFLAHYTPPSGRLGSAVASGFLHRLPRTGSRQSRLRAVQPGIPRLGRGRIPPSGYRARSSTCWPRATGRRRWRAGHGKVHPGQRVGRTGWRRGDLDR